MCRGERAFVLLNRFPYTSGHLMVAPARHTGDFAGLDADEALEIHSLAAQGIAALREVYAPEGYNLGWNLGRVAGAGIVDHVHLHVVPRWAGDTNFMPVLADVRVIPEHLAATRELVDAAWNGRYAFGDSDACVPVLSRSPGQLERRGVERVRRLCKCQGPPGPPSSRGIHPRRGVERAPRQHESPPTSAAGVSSRIGARGGCRGGAKAARLATPSQAFSRAP